MASLELKLVPIKTESRLGSSPAAFGKIRRFFQRYTQRNYVEATFTKIPRNRNHHQAQA